MPIAAPTADTLPFLRQVPAFSLLDEGELAALAAELRVVRFDIGEVVCRAGDAADSFYVIYSGRARVVAGTGDEELTVATLSRGDHFGEQALLTGGTRAFTVRAADELVLLELAQAPFRAVIARRPEVREYFEGYVGDLATRNFLRLCSSFRALRPGEVQGLIAILEEHSFAPGDEVVREGEPGDRFYLIRSGQAAVVRDGRTLQRLSEGQYFGERALLTGEPRAATVVAVTPLSTLSLAREHFLRLLDRFPRLRESLEPLTYSTLPAPPELEGRPVGPEPEAPVEAAAPEPGARPTMRGGRRPPVVLQIGERDCGAACLAMIGRVFGREYSLATLRELAEVSRDGSSLRSLGEAGEKLGFRTRPVRCDLRHLEQLALPLIAHWGGNHFIVVYEVDARGVLIGDPALGLRRYTTDEFRAGWTGLALLIEPGDQLAPSEPGPGLLKRFLPLVAAHRGLLFEVLACSVLLQLFGLAIPLFMQAIVDRVIVHRDLSMLNLMLAGMAAVVLFELVTSALRQVLLVHAVRRIDVSIDVQFLAHVLRLPARYFENMRVGDLLNRFRETRTVRQLLTGTAMTALLDGVTILLYLGVMVAYNLPLTLVVLATVPVFAALTLGFAPRMTANYRAAFEAEGHVQSHLVEMISGVQTVKTSCAERPVRWKWEELLLKNLRLEFRGMHYSLLLDSLGKVLQMAVTAALLWFGARLVIAGQLTLGQLMAFFALTGTLLQSVTRTLSIVDEVQHVRLALQRLGDVFDTKAEETRGPTSAPPMGAVRGHVRFEQVTFRYTEQARRNAVENIDLEVRPGETVALVGRSGCGKSTLVKLLLRLYEPSSGRITVDGQDIHRVDARSWRGQVGAVLQETFLFSGTIAENIALGRPDAGVEEIRRAATLAGAHDFIAELPLAYNTMVGERGASLSGGQRQRINIARALLADPKILILDEATSALDTESERAIQRNLETVLRDRTTLVIAHRLSTVRNADRIVVMDQGVIVEQGTHEELMARRGLYFYLVSQQLEQ